MAAGVIVHHWPSGEAVSEHLPSGGCLPAGGGGGVPEDAAAGSRGETRARTRGGE